MAASAQQPAIIASEGEVPTTARRSSERASAGDDLLDRNIRCSVCGRAGKFKHQKNFLHGEVGKARTCDAAENVPRKSGWTDRMECVRIDAAVYSEALLTAASENNLLHAACA